LIATLLFRGLVFHGGMYEFAKKRRMHVGRHVCALVGVATASEAARENE